MPFIIVHFDAINRSPKKVAEWPNKFCGNPPAVLVYKWMLSALGQATLAIAPPTSLFENSEIGNSAAQSSCAAEIGDLAS
jgi:hypothetical protein